MIPSVLVGFLAKLQNNSVTGIARDATQGGRDARPGSFWKINHSSVCRYAKPWGRDARSANFSFVYIFILFHLLRWPVCFCFTRPIFPLSPRLFIEYILVVFTNSILFVVWTQIVVFWFEVASGDFPSLIVSTCGCMVMIVFKVGTRPVLVYRFLEHSMFRRLFFCTNFMSFSLLPYLFILESL